MKAVEKSSSGSSSESENEDHRLEKTRKENNKKVKGREGEKRKRKTLRLKERDKKDNRDKRSGVQAAGAPPTIVLDPVSLSVPGRAKVNFATDQKPTTPKSKRKMVSAFYLNLFVLKHFLDIVKRLFKIVKLVKGN